MSGETEKPAQAPDKQSEDKPKKEDQGGTHSAERNAANSWALVGKVGALVALIVGAITIYNALNPQGPRLVANCTVTDISEYLGRAETEALARAKETLSVDVIKRSMPHAAGKAAQELPVLQALAATLSKQLSGGSKFRFLIGTQALRCTIVNDGTEPATEVALHLPHQPARVFVNKDELGQKDSRSKSILLETLPAGPTLTVEAWTDTYRNELSESNIFLNYRGGKGKVYVGRTYFATADTLAHFWETFGLLGLLWFVAASLLIGLGPMAMIEQAQKKSKQDSKGG